VVASLTGDRAGAARVELALPETGVCNSRPVAPAALRDNSRVAVAAAGGCCGTRA
jgi:hypothetical protein